ncbi:TlpA family protein disulfide reductase [Rhodopirellula sp. P2]|uniref:TlpA family protein disulfide reductase n=1 Tax=Rhodopirellula sp. P2 TaxID=2127060 RepID=UPI00236810B6|nr:TlpA disulfide reductase family protein [Rhodopirellula sp. P2]WDQ15322.1 TlpA disulfide reductase family protein [Rhodopirellula sp. P2]
MPSSTMDRLSFSRSIRYALLPAMMMVGGCGSSSSPTPEAPEVSTETTEVEVVEEASPREASQPNLKTPGGFALPDGDLPEAPVKRNNPGEGGMSLPDDLDLGSSAESSSVSEPTGDTSTNLVASAKKVAIEYAAWDKVRATATQSGTVTVLDVWSLACGPCLKEFPNLVAMQKRFGDKVVAIGANVDFDGRKSRPPESYEPKVTEFLSSVDAEFDNFIVQTPSDEVFEAIGIGSIPAVLVFDAEGKLVKQFSDVGETAGFNYADDIVPLVEKLLN